MHSPVNGHLAPPHLLVTVNSDLWTTVYNYLFEQLFSILLSIYLGVELLGHMVILCLTLWGNAKLFSTPATPFKFPVAMYEDSEFSIFTLTLVILHFSFFSFSFFLFLFFFFIEVELIYSVVPISTVQQSDSVLHIYSFFNILFHYGLSQEILFIHSKCNSLHLPAPNSQPIPFRPSLSRLWQPWVWALCLWVCFCFVDRFICAIF